MASPNELIKSASAYLNAGSVSYEDLVKFAGMTVAEIRSKGWDKSGITTLSDSKIQSLIDSSNNIVEKTDSQKSSWSTLSDAAKKAYDSMYDGSLKYLETTSGVTSDQWDAAYSASVSDNYAKKDTAGLSFDNVTVNSGEDNIPIDWSELQTMKKTQLSDGKFADSDTKGVRFDSFGSDAKYGDTKTVCGGTITYLGTKDATYNRNSKTNAFQKLINGEYKGTTTTTDMVHYDGVLGSFDYDATQFHLGYWQCKIGDNYVNVPVLHYAQAGTAENLAGEQLDGFTDGSTIKIPEGLKVADYMFADTGITSMPQLPDSLTSAHSMFMDCSKMTGSCKGATVQSGVHQGMLSMPANLKDISWMFAGCTNMTQYFGDLGKDMQDARYAFSECENLGYSDANGSDGKMNNTFEMPDTTHLRYANAEYLSNMFDNTNTSVTKKVSDYVAANGDLGSQWTQSDGTHNNNYDALIDGSSDNEKKLNIVEEASRQKILKMIDKDAKSLSGVASDTNSLASSAVQLTDDGTLGDDSTWAKFRQDDFSGTSGSAGQFGQILNKAIPAVGTYAVSKALLNEMTNGKAKWLTTIGAVAIAAVPQVVGYGNTLTPMLDWTANVVGSDTKAGQFLTTLSSKLKGNVSYNTSVSELSADQTFEDMQSSATKYATNQMSKSMQNLNMDLDGDGTAESVSAITRFDTSKQMAANGASIANDANLLFIACEPEENLKNTLSDGITKTTLTALKTKMDSDVEAANGDAAKIENIRKTYSGYYMTMLYNLDAYDNGAVSQLQNNYMSDPKLEQQAMNGLGKVMRDTVTPLYSDLSQLQTQWKQKYGTDFLSDQQMNDTMKTFDITGLGTFNDYDPNKNYADGSDTYVSQMKTYQQALVKDIAGASTQTQINDAYSAYYETAYGWALDEAEKHGVVLNKRGAQTTEERNSFAKYVEQVETESGTKLAENKTDSKTDDITSTANRAAQAQAVLGLSDEDLNKTNDVSIECQ